MYSLGTHQVKPALETSRPLKPVRELQIYIYILLLCIQPSSLIPTPVAEYMLWPYLILSPHSQETKQILVECSASLSLVVPFRISPANLKCQSLIPRTTFYKEPPVATASRILEEFPTRQQKPPHTSKKQRRQQENKKINKQINEWNIYPKKTRTDIHTKN